MRRACRWRWADALVKQVPEDQAHRRLAEACELPLFACLDGGEEVGEVLLRVLGADLQGLRVVERGCGVNFLASRPIRRSPDYFKVIKLYLPVGGYQRDLPLHCLRDDDAIERVAMVERKGFRAKNVIKADRQQCHVQRRYLGKQCPDRPADRSQSASVDFVREFPYGSFADEHLISGVGNYFSNAISQPFRLYERPNEDVRIDHADQMSPSVVSGALTISSSSSLSIAAHSSSVGICISPLRRPN